MFLDFPDDAYVTRSKSLARISSGRQTLSFNISKGGKATQNKQAKISLNITFRLLVKDIVKEHSRRKEAAKRILPRITLISQAKAAEVSRELILNGS